MGLDLNHGGHLSHGSPVNISGTYFKQVSYAVKEETGTIDYDMMEKVAREHKPKLIIGGASAYSRDFDWKRMRALADEIGAILMGDISHPAGLIAKGELNNAIEYCHIVTTTTHKTLRGPRGGMILMGKDFPNPMGKKTPKGEIKMMSAVLDSAVFPGCQGGPLEHVIAAKAVAFGENTLVKADITINKNMVPFDSRSAFQTSGIRIGTPAITTRGLKEDEMETIVEMIDAVLSDVNNESLIEATRKKVNAMMENRPLFAW